MNSGIRKVDFPYFAKLIGQVNLKDKNE